MSLAVYLMIIEAGNVRNEAANAVGRYSGLQYKSDGSGELEFYTLTSNDENLVSSAIVFLLSCSSGLYLFMWVKQIWHELLLRMVTNDNFLAFKIVTCGVISLQTFKERYLQHQDTLMSRDRQFGDLHNLDERLATPEDSDSQVKPGDSPLHAPTFSKINSMVGGTV